MERLSKEMLLDGVYYTSDDYNILPNLYSFIEREQHFTKIAQKVYNWLDCDPLHSLMVSPLSKTYYFEFTGATYGGEIYPTAEVETYLKRLMNGLGYRNLYDVC